MDRNVIIIGAGFGGLALACILGEAGYKVSIYEKNAKPGGRAGVIKAKGFTFDAGPSWYLMPDIFAHFFALIGEDVNKLLNLKRLDPSYQVVFKDTLLGSTKIHGDLQKDGALFESFEPLARQELHEYVERASYQYKVAVDKFLYKNYDSVLDFISPRMIREGMKLNVLSNMQKYVSNQFSNPEIQKILQYQLVFLGASPKNAPALYNLMSHVDFKQGVYYPMGGIHAVTEALVGLAKARGVKIYYNSPAEKILVENNRATGIKVKGKTHKAVVVVSNADIHHTDTELLDQQHRMYSSRYWKRRTMAPSALVLYLGVKGSYPTLEHHNLVFSKDWDANFDQIFKGKKFPKDPSFYVCNPNKTDPDVAPKNHENLFVLVPISPGIKYTSSQLEEFVEKTQETMEKTLHLDNLRGRIIYQKIFCREDFESTYNSYKGSALGLAHTLRQTAIFRPRNQHKNIHNLLYVGANTVPGIGLPMCLISAELAYKRIAGDTSSGPLESLKS